MQAYWHIHHDMALEWSSNIEERVAYIRERKPADEIETRLRWMTPVKGEPPPALEQVGEAFCKAREGYHKDNNAWTWGILNHAGTAYEWVLIKNTPAIEVLHAAEHPDCPWDGKTLFPKEE